MRFFPNKKTMEWVGFYLTLLPMVVGGVSYVAIRVERYLSSQIGIVDVVKGQDDFKGVFSSFHPSRSINISYPYVSATLSSDFIDKVNREIEGDVLDAVQSDLLEYRVRYEVGVLTKNLISLKIYQYYYYDGAMNGNESEFSLNFDPAKERFFDFFDVFDARRDALNELKKKIAKELNAICEYGAFEDRFQKASYVPRFFIKENDIEFVFSEYEVTPGVCGSFVVKIPYKNIVNYLKVDGPLGRFAPASGDWEAGGHFVNNVMEELEKLESK